MSTDERGVLSIDDLEGDLRFLRNHVEDAHPSGMSLAHEFAMPMTGRRPTNGTAFPPYPSLRKGFPGAMSAWSEQIQYLKPRVIFSSIREEAPYQSRITQIRCRAGSGGSNKKTGTAFLGQTNRTSGGTEKPAEWVLWIRSARETEARRYPWDFGQYNSKTIPL